MTDQSILEKARQWLHEDFDTETREQVRFLIEKDPEELTDAFYRNLEFGTGGLRGIMGVGTNRMNKYTVGMATQGLANYLIKSFPGREISVAIAHDCRNNSRLFAVISANVLSANGIRVFLFDDLRPTPELSFAIRHYHCQSGIVITASHNPKEYNGYKVYWDDGGQLVPPHDENVIREVEKISAVSEVRFSGDPERIITIGQETDEAYISTLTSLSLAGEPKAAHAGIHIVYSALHGTGTRLVPDALRAFGFSNISLVADQMIPDGNFPTVISPNPEEKDAMYRALELAADVGADLVMATDPDADRLGVGVRDLTGRYILLNGNQTASLLIFYLLSKYREHGKLDGRQFIAKTIVTSDLLAVMAAGFGVPCHDVLTGFKYIAEIIRNLEGNMSFIGGGEESYGFLVGDKVRDKDAVISCCMIAETAAWAASRGQSLFGLLVDIYTKYGFYKESLVSVTRKGKAGAEEIRDMMDRFRSDPPRLLNGIPVTMVKDYLRGFSTKLPTGDAEPIQLPKSNVLQFYMADGSRVTIRPSGTEPKIKFYFGVVGNLDKITDYEGVDTSLQQKIDAIISELGF